MRKDSIKTEQEIKALRESGRRLAVIVAELLEKAESGVSTGVLGNLAETRIREAGGDPIFKGYGKDWGAPPFPAAVCISLNEEVVHGIPKTERVLVSGDLIKIDIGMRYQGMVSDMARMKIIGQGSEKTGYIKSVTEAALEAGIATLRDGSTTEEYAQAVEGVAKAAGFSCVRDLVGHGVGHELHEELQIPNHIGSGLPNVRFRAGMTVALEPMINMGTYQVRLAEDGWTFVTADGSLSGHVENTILITSTGSEILTQI